ncbi:DUF4307 domain-containing protein [Saxibacter everestensis]|uniref:DUF4307 domain-containing protein n=1 Tax=Saxibacter everestensis TaxID=2909229 RepID=A0ABY8QQG2_9MICO|nr:DUF4307 domain-containing protein [Brevibacteriaceae bacterium ZFBP1038]
MSTPRPDALDSRYGRTPKPPKGRKRLIAAAAALLLAVGAVGWVAFGKEATEPTSKDISFELTDASETKVSFSVLPDKQREVRCSIQALNEQYAIVGYAEVTIQPDPSVTTSRPRVIDVDVRTQQLAVSGGVEKCRFVD